MRPNKIHSVVVPLAIEFAKETYIIPSRIGGRSLHANTNDVGGTKAMLQNTVPCNLNLLTDHINDPNCFVNILYASEITKPGIDFTRGREMLDKSSELSIVHGGAEKTVEDWRANTSEHSEDSSISVSDNTLLKEWLSDGGCDDREY